jgi:hypothetical protein
MRKHAPVPFALALSLGWAPSGAVVQTAASDCPVTVEAPCVGFQKHLPPRAGDFQNH